MARLRFSSKSELLEYTKNYETPFYVYDENTIKEQCNILKDAFHWTNDFQNYFAVKATPNPAILKIIMDQGFGLDCSSFAELLLAESVGFKKGDIYFTSNNTTMKEYEKAIELGAVVNLDDISHVGLIHQKLGLPNHLSFRYNPGPSRSLSNSTIIGNPIDSKFGMTKEQLLAGFEQAQSLGCNQFSLHTMVVSNCLDINELLDTSKMMFELVKEIQDRLSITICRVNLGGGIGIPYRPIDKPIDVKMLSQAVMKIYQATFPKESQLKISFECGRFITGPAGVLLTRIINKKSTYKNYLGVDASIANIMRPAMYGAYHSIVYIPSKEAVITSDDNAISTKARSEATKCLAGVFDIVGSLCENNDKLAVDRFIDEKVNIGDILAIQDAGAHCSAMSFNYNGKLRCAEYLRAATGQLKLIRRAETYSDLFATLKTQQSANS